MYKRFWSLKSLFDEEPRRQVAFDLQNSGPINYLEIKQYGRINYFKINIKFNNKIDISLFPNTEQFISRSGDEYLDYQVEFNDKSAIKLILNNLFLNYQLPYEICAEILLDLSLVKNQEEILSELSSDLDIYGFDITTRKLLGYLNVITNNKGDENFNRDLLLLNFAEICYKKVSIDKTTLVLENFIDPQICYEVANHILHGERFSELDIQKRLTIALKLALKSKDNQLINVVFNQLTMPDPGQYTFVEVQVNDMFNYEQLLFMADILKRKNCQLKKQNNAASSSQETQASAATVFSIPSHAVLFSQSHHSSSSASPLDADEEMDLGTKAKK